MENFKLFFYDKSACCCPSVHMSVYILRLFISFSYFVRKFRAHKGTRGHKWGRTSIFGYFWRFCSYIWIHSLTRQVYNGPRVVEFIAAILSVYQYYWGKKSFCFKKHLDRNLFVKINFNQFPVKKFRSENDLSQKIVFGQK